MRAKDFIKELKVDNRNGWGQTPNNANIDYQGLKVMMKPSVFLQLAANLPIDDLAKKKIAAMVAHARQGGTFGAPTLYINVPAEWEDGVVQGDGIPSIRGHEGRHRMNVQMELEGDVPVETHIFIPYFKNKNWAKDNQSDYTPEIVHALQSGSIKNQDGKSISGAPLFEV
jgi:hypothetical protein